MPRPISIFVIGLSLLPAAAGAAGQDALYVNSRYHYEARYPQSLLTPQGEPDAHDGQKFLNRRDKASLLVYASYNAAGETLSGQYLQELKRPVTYKVRRANWFVVSGTEHGCVFYDKVIFQGPREDDKILTMELTYPVSLRRRYDAVAARVSRSLRFLD